jgi:hypothetical protein
MQIDVSTKERERYPSLNIMFADLMIDCQWNNR